MTEITSLEPPTVLSPNVSPDIRVNRGQTIAATEGAIRRLSKGVYSVKSQSGGGSYQVRYGDFHPRCECKDFAKRDLPCKHIWSVKFYLERAQALPSGTVVTQTLKVSYPQKWHAYTEAQKHEMEVFDALLSDLVDDVPDPRPPQKLGRPRVPICDLAFCAVQRAYSGLALRKAWGLLGRATERVQVTYPPSWVMPSLFLNRPDVSPLLEALVAKSALPLAGIEHSFAPDSTGFRTTCFSQWNAEKHGQKRLNKWLKLHALVGTKSHAIVRVRITVEAGSDYVHFEPLVRSASDDFDIEEVYADKAYTGRSNYAIAEEIGFDLYTPFKSRDTSRPTAQGRDSRGVRHTSRLWRKMFHYVQLHREEWESYYHQRSNVEATFSAVKRMFGDTLLSRNETAQVNELLCKVIAYNITILIHEMYENGLVPEFLASVDPTPSTLEA